MPEEEEELKRDLSLVDAISTNAGTVIGSGIFAVPAFIALRVTDPLLIIAVFVAGGLLSILGGLTFSELAAAVPKSGGIYAWLRETLGDTVGFLYAWSTIAVIQTAGIAAVSIFVSESLLALFHPYDPLLAKLIAINLIVLLAVINYAGVKRGGQVQSITFIAKTVGIVGFIALVFLTVPFAESGLAGAEWGNFDVGLGLFSAFSAAMITVLWAYDGWYQVAFVAEEVDDPGETLPKSIFVGLGIVIAVYLVFVLAILWALGPAQTALIGQNANAVVSSDAALAVGGIGGLTFLSLVMVVSGTGTNNAQVMTSPRLAFAMARDGLFLDPLKKVHSVFHTPHRAIILMVGLGIFYTILGTFELLINLAIYTLWFFMAAGGVAVFIYRRDRPDMERPYKVPGYPYVPAAFVAVAVLMLIGTFLDEPMNSLIGTLIVLAGLPVYYGWQWLKDKPGVDLVPADAPEPNPEPEK